MVYYREECGYEREVEVEQVPVESCRLGVRTEELCIRGK